MLKYGQVDRAKSFEALVNEYIKPAYKDPRVQEIYADKVDWNYDFHLRRANDCVIETIADDNDGADVGSGAEGGGSAGCAWAEAGPSVGSAGSGSGGGY